MKISFLSLILVALIGCGSVPTNSSRYRSSSATTSTSRVGKSQKIYHTVKKGESLWKIAKDYSVTVDELQQLNKIKYPDRINKGDVVAIPLYRHTKTQFRWPAHGTITESFGQTIGNHLNKGINIKTQKNASVVAAKAGTVSFAGYVRGYGNAVILEHMSNFFTVYSNLSKLQVEKGQSVSQGQSLGKVGMNLRRGIYLLHFEIRKNYQARNPLRYLSH